MGVGIIHGREPATPVRPNVRWRLSFDPSFTLSP